MKLGLYDCCFGMYIFGCNNFYIVAGVCVFLMEADISQVVESIVSGLPQPFPYCIYVRGGGEIRDDVMSLLVCETSSLVVDVEPRCDYCEVNLDQLVSC